MNTATPTSTAAALNKTIDRHAGGQPVGKQESHSLDSLCARILAPCDVVEKLLGAGILRSNGPVHANDETGLHSFDSDLLNELRRSVLAAIVEKTIEESDGADGQITLAAGHAVGSHVASFLKPKGERKEFSRFPAGLVQLSSPYPYHGDDEEPGLARRAAGAAGKVAAVGAAYAGASYLSGHKPGLGAVAAIRAGHARNVGDLKGVATRTGKAVSPAILKVMNALRGRAAR